MSDKIEHGNVERYGDASRRRTVTLRKDEGPGPDALKVAGELVLGVSRVEWDGGCETLQRHQTHRRVGTVWKGRRYEVAVPDASGVQCVPDGIEAVRKVGKTQGLTSRCEDRLARRLTNSKVEEGSSQIAGHRELS